jgi:hypothetical protein
MHAGQGFDHKAALGTTLLESRDDNLHFSLSQIFPCIESKLSL